MPRRLIATALLLAGLGRAAWAGSTPPSGTLPAQAPPAPVAPGAEGDPLDVYVLTFGPGDHPFLKFGHDAIWIHDANAGSDRVYNFGTFKFDSPRLILDFLGGRMTYWLSVSTLPAVLATYKHENRSIAAQKLALDPRAKLALERALEINARPENRAYKYDYFLDNCSTRVRDAVVAAGGALRGPARAPGRLTLRGHALRMAADSVPFYLALDLVLGPRVDRPIDRWGEMFLPEELARGLSTATAVRPVAGPSGSAARASVALVSDAAVLFTANRPPPRDVPPGWARWFFMTGTMFGLGMFGLGVQAGRHRWARLSLGGVVAVWGFVTGFIGCFLVYVWAFTDHVVAHRNQNILLCAPWAIGLAVLGVGVALGRPGAVRKAFRLSLYGLAAALAACALKAGLAPRQANGDLIAFFLPAWLGTTVALARLRTALRGTALRGTALRA
jgi:hypothetical protein